MRHLLKAVTFLALSASVAHAVDEEKQYASARCGTGLEPRVSGKSTIHCNFKPGSANLKDDPNCVSQIEPLLRDLNDFKDVSVLVQGFADAKGKAEANKSLSIERAAAVRKYLIEGGIAGDRFIVDGFGSDPAFFVCNEKTSTCDAQNRRIEVVKYLCKKPKQKPAEK
jgi:OOP family OmpA-OmpF porin